MTLIAIASEDDEGLEGQVSAHFGRCPYVTLVEVKDEQVLDCWVEKNPNAELHQPGTMPLFIRALGASVVLAGGMGPRAVQIFRSHGIEVATGSVGPVRKVLEDFLHGRMKGAAPCQHSESHGCGGHGASEPRRDDRAGHGREARPQRAGGLRVAMAAQDDSGLTAAMDPRFGRAPYFVVADLESGEVLGTLPNAARDEAHGSGTAAARIIADSGAEAAIAVTFSTKVERALLVLGIELWNAPEGLTVGQALERLRAGELARASGA